MRLYLYFFLFLFLNCQSRIASSNAVPQEHQIPFEDKNHYLFSLTAIEFLIISSQEKMDEIFRIIHTHNAENRFSPIPALVDNETYIIIKPRLKNSNDITVNSVSLNNNTLYVKVSEFDNPDFSRKSRVSPSILLKLNRNISFKKVTIK